MTALIDRLARGVRWYGFVRDLTGMHRRLAWDVAWHLAKDPETRLHGWKP